MMFYYVATPYSKYPGGTEAAYRLALDTTGLLIRAGVPVFSPIVHTHPIAVHCGMTELELAFWLQVDEPLMQAASGLIFVKAETWEISKGMRMERDYFTSAGKRIIDMLPGVVSPELFVYNARVSWRSAGIGGEL